MTKSQSTVTKKTVKADPFPRTFLAPIAESIITALKPYGEVFVGGSFIRGLSTCHDLDLAYCGSMEGVELFRSWGRILVQGPFTNRIAAKVVNQEVQIDLWNFPRSNWGAGCMFVAGSGRLNVIQRVQASKQGYTLGFSLKQNGRDIPLETEAAVYAHLGWPWLPYSERNK